MSKILVTGATGFVGRALVLRLLGEGHAVLALVRSPARARARLGAEVELVDAGGGQPALVAAVEAADAIVNLAGESIGGGRWTRARRRAITESRVGLTDRLVDALEAASRRPATLVSASASGYYGDRGEELLDEEAPAGTGFLAEVCTAWEQAARRAEALGVRVVRARLGVVLGLGGGFLGETLPLFRRGLGAHLGNGRQYVPWIHLDDLTAVLAAACADGRYRGPVNVVAGSIPMAALVKGLASALGRTVHLKVPALALRLGLGAAADIVLGSQRVEPARLRALGFQPRHPQLDGALAELIGRMRTVNIERLGGSAPAPTDADAYLQRRPPSYLLSTRVVLDAPVEEVFNFFSRPQNLGLLTPAAMALEISRAPAQVAPGETIDYTLRVAGAPLRWRTVIARWSPGRLFIDAQERGPYRSWWHEHHFAPDGARTVMEDRVYYAPPFGWLGRIAQRLFVAPQLREVFGYRAQAIGLRFRRG